MLPIDLSRWLTQDKDNMVAGSFDHEVLVREWLLIHLQHKRREKYDVQNEIARMNMVCDGSHFDEHASTA